MAELLLGVNSSAPWCVSAVNMHACLLPVWHRGATETGLLLAWIASAAATVFAIGGLRYALASARTLSFAWRRRSPS